jgi:hypothetical protein
MNGACQSPNWIDVPVGRRLRVAVIALALWGSCLAARPAWCGASPGGTPLGFCRRLLCTPTSGSVPPGAAPCLASARTSGRRRPASCRPLVHRPLLAMPFSVSCSCSPSWCLPHHGCSELAGQRAKSQDARGTAPVLPVRATLLGVGEREVLFRRQRAREARSDISGIRGQDLRHAVDHKSASRDGRASRWPTAGCRS